MPQTRQHTVQDDYSFTCQNDSVCLLVTEQGEYGTFLPGPHILAKALGPWGIVAKSASYQYIEAQDVMIQSTVHHCMRHRTSRYEAQYVLLRGTVYHDTIHSTSLYEVQYIILRGTVYHQTSKLSLCLYVIHCVLTSACARVRDRTNYVCNISLSLPDKRIKVQPVLQGLIC